LSSRRSLLEKGHGIDRRVGIRIDFADAVLAGLDARDRSTADTWHRVALPKLSAAEAADGHEKESCREAQCSRTEKQILFRLRIGVGLELDESDDEQSDSKQQRNYNEVQEREFAVATVVCDQLLSRQRLLALARGQRRYRRRSGR